jgi:hypothetical protein
MKCKSKTVVIQVPLKTELILFPSPLEKVPEEQKRWGEGFRERSSLKTGIPKRLLFIEL